MPVKRPPPPSHGCRLGGTGLRGSHGAWADPSWIGRRPPEKPEARVRGHWESPVAA